MRTSDYSPAASFLARFHAEAPWQIIAIKKNVAADGRESGGIEVKTFFNDPLRARRVQVWGEMMNRESKDLYFAINPLRDGTSGKASKAAVVEARWLWVDCDPPKGLAGEALVAWRTSKLDELRSGKDGIPPPSWIIDSGRGLWAFWHLAAPAPVDGYGPQTKAVESYLRDIADVFEGDRNAGEIARIARLPGFVNHKTGKRAVVVERHAEPQYQLSDFPAPSAAAPVEGARAAVAIDSDLINDGAAVGKVIEYLKLVAPLAVQGEGGRRTALLVLQRCMDYGCDFETSIGLMEEHWNDRCSPPWEPGALARELRGLSRESPIGIKHPTALARAAFEGVSLPPKEPSAALGGAAHSSRATADCAEELPIISAASFAGREPPPRKFLVHGLIPSRAVTLLGGDGGTGKGILALSLAAAVVTDRKWLGLDVQRGPALYVSAEDECDEIERRLFAISKGEEVDMASLSELEISPLADRGEGALLVVGEGTGRLVQTNLWSALVRRIARAHPALVVLDPLADVFGGNEIDRGQVRQFVSMLHALAIKYDCAILLLSHPSVEGMRSGSGLSGSTAWNNSVRSRLYFDRVKDGSGSERDEDVRALTVKKANYARTGAEIRLRYSAGRFVVDGADIGVPGEAAAKAERVFLKLLQEFERQGRNVSVNPGNRYAPAIFSEHQEAEGVRKKAFRDAMEQLLAAGCIAVEKVGPKSRQTSRLVPVRDKIVLRAIQPPSI